MPKDCWAAAAADGRKVPRFPQNVFSVRKADAGQRAETEARFVLLTVAVRRPVPYGNVKKRRVVPL